MKKTIKFLLKSISALALGLLAGFFFSIDAHASEDLPLDSNGVCYTRDLTANAEYSVNQDATIYINDDKEILRLTFDNQYTLTIRGDGIHTFTIHNTNDHAISGPSSYSVIVDSGNIYLRSNSHTPMDACNNLTINGGSFTARGLHWGIECTNLTVSGGTVCGIIDSCDTSYVTNAGITAVNANFSGGVITAKIEDASQAVIDRTSSIEITNLPTFSNGMSVFQPEGSQFERDVLFGYINCYTVKDANGSRLSDVIIKVSNTTNNTNNTGSSGDSDDDILMDKFEAAAALGGKQKVYWDVDNTLSYAQMKFLEEHPDITLVYKYSYLEKDYRVVIPGSKAKADPDIPYYGPLYLFGTYGKYRE